MKKNQFLIVFFKKLHFIGENLSDLKISGHLIKPDNYSAVLVPGPPSPCQSYAGPFTFHKVAVLS